MTSETRRQAQDDELTKMKELVELALSLGFRVYDAEWYKSLDKNWADNPKYLSTGKIIDYDNKNRP